MDESDDLLKYAMYISQINILTFLRDHWTDDNEHNFAIVNGFIEMMTIEAAFL